MCTLPIRKEESMSNAANEQYLRELRIASERQLREQHTEAERELRVLRTESVRSAFDRVKGADEVLDKACETQDWPGARKRLDEIEKLDSAAALRRGDSKVALLRLSVPILRMVLEDL